MRFEAGMLTPEVAFHIVVVTLVSMMSRLIYQQGRESGHLSAHTSAPTICSEESYLKPTLLGPELVIRGLASSLTSAIGCMWRKDWGFKPPAFGCNRN
jgi:hypothetical protein